MIVLSQQLKRLRLQSSMSQSDIARLVGVSQQAVGKWELNKSEPDSKTLLRLAEIYGVTVDQLLGAESSSSKSVPVLSCEEKDFLSLYRSIPVVDRKTAMNIVKAFADSISPRVNSSSNMKVRQSQLVI